MDTIIKEKKRTIEICKVAYNGKQKRNLVDLEISLKEDKQGRYEFSASGNLWNHLQTDIYYGGQCIDSLAEEFPELLEYYDFSEVRRLWKLYHLNTMNAGTIQQSDYLESKAGRQAVEAIIEKSLRQVKYPWQAICHYDASCQALATVGLLVDNGYKYGTSWLYRPIPENDLAIIKYLVCWED